MKPMSLSPEKCTIAWFKLAEFVARREKQRALGIYKLLALSIDDPAFMLQLEGDLLLAFNDMHAATKYAQAAALYEEHSKVMQALAIYEHLALIDPLNSSYQHKLIALYQEVRLFDFLPGPFKQLVEIALRNNEIVEALQTLSLASIHCLADSLVPIYELLVMHLISHQEKQSHHLYHETILEYMNKVITHYSEQNNTENVATFIKTIEQTSEYYKEKAYAYVETKTHSQQ